MTTDRDAAGIVPPRLLVVTADDFGQSEGINAGVARAHEQGVVTSASLMVRWPASPAAAAYARDHPELSVGLHLDLGEWRYRWGNWEPIYRVCDPDDDEAVAAAVDAQLARFEELVGRAPTHLDSHQHVHRQGPASRHLRRAAGQLGVPLRDVTPTVRYEGGFYGMLGNGTPQPDSITFDAFVQLLESLQDSAIELGCHPGLGDDVDSPYGRQRRTEVDTLCDPRLPDVIGRLGFELGSFDDLARWTDHEAIGR